MTQLIRKEVQDDLLSRGYSRRQMFRTAMMLAGGAAALSIKAEMAFAADDDATGRTWSASASTNAGPVRWNRA